jgi:tRNA threonylcarbamoyladenosine biosynthesis protein TsaB
MPKPLILHIETSAELCSIALSRGSQILSAITSDERNKHSTVLAPDVQTLLSTHDAAPGDLQAIAVSGGPGSYTGLRVGVSFAKAMCFALDIPLIAVDTLESLAIAARSDLREDAFYCANIDARRMEVYFAEFDALGKRISPNSSLIIEKNTFAQRIEIGEKIIFCGTGTAKCADILTHEAIIHYPMQCQAEHLVIPALRSYKQGGFADLETFRPDYVKPPNITASTRSLL